MKVSRRRRALGWLGPTFDGVNKGRNDEHYGAVIRDLAEDASNVGMAVLDAAGNVDSVQANLSHQIALLGDLTAAAIDLGQGNQTLMSEVALLRESGHSLVEETDRSRGKMAESLLSVGRVVEWVSSTSDELESLQAEMHGVEKVVRHIDKIAQQTHVLALNAHIEATRGSGAGSGFTVIANSIRGLADQTIEAASSISRTLAPLIRAINELSTSTEVARSSAESAQISTQEVFESLGRSEEATTALGRNVDAMAGFSEATKNKVDLFSESLTSLLDGVGASQTQLTSASSHLKDLLKRAQSLIQLSSQTGMVTADTPYITMVVSKARAIESLFLTGIESGEITLVDLFDEHYTPIPGTNPQQYRTRFVDYTDRVLPSIQEEILQFSPLVVFAACVDRCGYLGTHNRKYSRAQGEDPRWNAINCRNRQIFSDVTGLAAARNRDAYLLQTYRRDMGGGDFVFLKDLSAPIFVQGRHWGALRLAYRVERRSGDRAWSAPPANPAEVPVLPRVLESSSTKDGNARFRSPNSVTTC